MRGGSRLGRVFGKSSFAGDRRGAEMLELAIVFPVFILFLLFLFEIAYDQFVQTELEGALQLTAYQTQVGNYSDTASAAKFIDTDFCGNALAGALNCKSIYVRVQNVDPTQCTAPIHDFYSLTSGAVPVTGGVLQLGAYENDQNALGQGSAVGPTPCGNTAADDGWCNAGSDQFIIMSAVYVSPDFLGGLINGSFYTYNGSIVHASIATEAFYTEAFLPSGQVEAPSPC